MKVSPDEWSFILPNNENTDMKNYIPNFHELQTETKMNWDNMAFENSELLVDTQHPENYSQICHFLVIVRNYSTLTFSLCPISNIYVFQKLLTKQNNKTMYM